MSFNQMLHAFEKANLVDSTKARQIEKELAVSEVMKQEARTAKRKKELKAKLDAMAKNIAADPARYFRASEMEQELLYLHDQYPEEFDEVCTQAAYDFNLRKSA